MPTAHHEKIAQLNWIPFTHLHTNRSNTVSWIAWDKVDATLRVFENKPELSCFGIWSREDLSSIIGVTLGVSLPSNADEKLIGKHITWEDEPIEI